MRARIAIAALTAMAVIGLASPASAEEFEPRTGRTYVVRDMAGNLMERLEPAADAYARIGLSGRRLGRAVPGHGGALKFYDPSGALVATARRDGRPPGSMRLRTIAVVQGTEGASLGIVAAR